MATQLSTKDAIAAALNQHIQREIRTVQDKLTDEYTTRFRKALVQIAAEFSVRVDEYYQMETMDNEVRVTLKVPVREDEQT